MNAYSFDIFVSYAHVDIEFARELVNWIRISGFRVWFDEEQLVPGSRFRAGLQQGLRESQHLVTILTDSYTNRGWTQRELDLFDLTAEHTERRILAITIGDIDLGPLDQVFLVNQRIQWPHREFEGESFWLLYCGLTNQRPGPRTEWKTKGQRLIEKQRESADSACYAEIPKSSYLQEALSSDRPQMNIHDLISRCLINQDPDWQSPFSKLQEQLRDLNGNSLEEVLVKPWALGKAEQSAVVALAILPQWYGHYAVWPFIDIGCRHIARWFLSTLHLTHPAASEVWFTWVISEEIWPLLPKAASRMHVEGIREHFERVSGMALSTDLSFKEAEEDYDYGVMITPWNHFHLCWLALKLGDHDSSMAHAEALCESAQRGELRAGRFLTRLSNWSCFELIRSGGRLVDRIDSARAALGLESLSQNRGRTQRLEEIWSFVRAKMAKG